MGDMNAKIGKDSDNWKGTMGKESLGQMNENGLLFADVCAFSELMIGGTLFPHKPTHKATRISPDLQTENQTDHIAITKKWRRVLLDVNGLLFADVCAFNELMIGGTLFPHKPTHKATRISPDLQTENQTDHIAITTKWRRVLLDVKVKRVADISADYHLIVGEFRIKLAADKKMQVTRYTDMK